MLATEELVQPSLPPTTQSAISYVDLEQLLSYVARTVAWLLDSTEQVPDSLSRILREAESRETLSRFISDPQVRSIMVRKFSRKDDADEDDDEANQTSMDRNCIYELATEIKFANDRAVSVAFTKRSPYIEADKLLSQQLRVLTLSDKEPYQELHSHVSSTMAPYFKSCVRETRCAERDGDKMAPNVEKIIAELEMGLLHLQQNIDIPDVTLAINPIINQTMKRCLEQEGRPATVSDFGDKVEDSVFLNQLQNGVNRWIREIQRVTRFDRDPSSGTALQEISFWLNLERALLRIQEKRESPEVVLTLEILKKGKRFHATVSFDADTQLKEALATVNDYNPLMKDFPLNDLLSATDLDKLSLALQGIFHHLRKIRNTKYPFRRALKLIEAISRDLTAQMLKVLGTRRLMHIPFDEFERVISLCTKVFATWDDEYDKLQNLLRDMIKRQREERIRLTWRIDLAHKRLQSRMEAMTKFRQQHEQLRSVITRVLRPTASSSDIKRDRIDDGFVSGVTTMSGEQTSGHMSMEFADISAIEEVDSAYELVKEVDACDISKEGADAWEAAQRRYEERIDRVESCITARLRDQLGTAKSANEMFRIFSRYNALFVRPHIRGAIREYQTQLIQRVKDDIEALHENFKVKSIDYQKSKAALMGKVRDIPPTSGSIIWTKQIERQLKVYMDRVGDILGKGWENHLEGQKLSQDAKKFQSKLDTEALFTEWCNNVKERHRISETSGQQSILLFSIESCRSRSGKGNILRIRVNFMPEVITLAKEVRNLRALSFRVPLSILNKAHQANQLYPSAISLIESLKSYERTCDKLEERPSVKPLVAKMKQEVQELIAEGIVLVWDSYRVENYVQGFSKLAYNFEDKVDELLAIDERIEVEVLSLDTCEYSATVFSEILTRIQKAVDDLSLHQYSNLAQWTKALDARIEQRLAARLQAGISAWTEALKDEKRDEDMDDQVAGSGHKPGGEPKIAQLVHELRITNQIMYVSPSIEAANHSLMNQLFAWQNIILTLNRIESTRYQVGLERSAAGSYKDLLKKLPDGSMHLEAAYVAVGEKIKQMQDYIQQWLAYQSLWDLQPDMLYDRLGDNISRWINTLIEIKKSRSTFDTSDTQKVIGPIVVDYARVQSKVSLQYDSWHKDKVMSKFASLLSTVMADLHAAISKSRTDLELQSIDSAETKDAVSFITYVQTLKAKASQWEQQVELYKKGQQTLERQRFQFPPGWLHVDNIEGEWSAFNEIMRRKDTSIQTHLSSLRLKIEAEDQSLEKNTITLLDEWERNKPIQGNSAPVDALQCLAVHESKFNRLKEDRTNVARAKEALEITGAGVTEQQSESSAKLEVALEELQDLKGVWSKLSAIWSKIGQLRAMRWSTVQARDLRKNLDDIAGQLREMPVRLQTYASYDHVKSMIKGYQKVNLLIHELKSDALRERHWKQLIKLLNVRWVLSELTLGKVWDIDLQRNESVIKDIILIAQGELALENFLKHVESSWQEYELELVTYQNKCVLITKWDDLFNKVKEHINSLCAMKLSPYYKQFKDDACKWEDKLNKANSLFDVWIDVQRRWVYLEGIFSGSSDIQSLMPKETARFRMISSENQSGFLRLMRHVSEKRRVIDVLDIPDIQKNLEWLADQLTATQKALGEYLERERSSFPRFYFVGDEDLLEIIGNSNNISRLQKHFKKMFSGVASIILSDDSESVLGVCSREGEQLMFIQPVSIKQNPKINAWLRLLESEVRSTLTQLLAKAVVDIIKFKKGTFEPAEYISWLDSYQAQVAVLAAQISWSESVELALNTISKQPSIGMQPLEECLQSCEKTLSILADCVLQDQPSLRRRKLEHLITEFVHKRDITRDLIKHQVNSPKSFAWLRLMRFYFDPRNTEVLQQLSIHMANAKFHYGFEYLGVQDKLVQTPLTDRCYLTMTQALEARLGGSPFGPAGTGKTETVKALGHQLGRFVLVFNCDENFDFQAVGRIFIGLCQVGAWGCFDEFNRLEERMLSAVSQQIQTIQQTLRQYGNSSSSLSTGKDKLLNVDLIGKQVCLNPSMAIFITMNPGYAGRSNLPDNLKKLFRPLAMNKPDRQLIAQVMLFSQGFRLAESLANKIVPFFKLCHEQLSSHSHYDFGLRALKSVLVSAGNIKREQMSQSSEDHHSVDERLREQQILMQSVCETMKPKLVAEDVPLLSSLLCDVFPNVTYSESSMSELRSHIAHVCAQMSLVCGTDAKIHEGNQLTNIEGNAWLEKVLQLYQISKLNHGLMMVGPSGCGKSSACRVLLRALERMDGIESVEHIIDPKAISKDVLYGTLDPNTREWSDGLFTHILRKIIDNVRGEINKRHWIIFDGDVDPEWVENLNSVLDDNKLLTLPNGERLSLPPSVRIIFEVQDLKYATLATVSRCGMIWFNEDILTMRMLVDNFLLKLRNVPMDAESTPLDAGVFTSSAASMFDRPGITDSDGATAPSNEDKQRNLSSTLLIQGEIASVLEPHLDSDEGFVARALDFAIQQEHVMHFTRFRALATLFSMLSHTVRSVLIYNQSSTQMAPMAVGTKSSMIMKFEHLKGYVVNSLVFNVLWSFAGDAKLEVRHRLSTFIRDHVHSIEFPTQGDEDLLDYEVLLDTGRWSPWQKRVPQIEVETHKVAAPDVVVPTIDTVRHEALLNNLLAEHKPLILCGPPGSGKTMTLFSSLRSLANMQVVGLNFSSATTPELLLKTFEHYCSHDRTPNGLVLRPKERGWLILFCDEINLPAQDKYDTIRVISFLRQLVEHGGFWRTSDHMWVKTERIQFVGACNPPTDAGRKPLSLRFLRHVPVIYVDYPGRVPLTQIYSTFNRAMLRMVPALRGHADQLTAAMVEFYLLSQARFTQDMQPHYIYSPRELTRWVRGICEAIRPLDGDVTLDELVRLWAHEALRLFQDRLVDEPDRRWTDDTIDDVARRHFVPMQDPQSALARPILYSNWLTKDYRAVDRDALRYFTSARLKEFCEEELDVELVLFNEVLDHVLRIDRVFRQPQGHLLLIGVSGAGKTTLSKFVAWMNGLSIFQIKVHNRYTAANFDDDLRHVLRRAGCRNEKICFILDESNVMDSSFLERMNTLLANGEVPGLFEGDELSALMTQCREGTQREGQVIKEPEELYRWFTMQVMKNLHVVFTMNPSTEGLKDRASTSPALFNRCVVNWFGDWTDEALYQVGRQFTSRLDIDREYVPPERFPYAVMSSSGSGTESLQAGSLLTHRDAINNAFVYVHQTLHKMYERMRKRNQHVTYITPRHYLDFINQYVRLYREKCAELQEEQLHLTVGLTRISETVEQVEEMQASLKIKSTELEAKNSEAQSKMENIIQNREEARHRTKESEQIQRALMEQETVIAEKRRSVMEELSKVEPAVREAQQAVQSIKKQNLHEVRSMTNPPAPVKLAMESICLLLGESNTDWKTVRSMIVSENFIPTIVNFSSDKISDTIRKQMREKYLKNPDYSFEKINRASSACGPLVKWACAQLNYVDMVRQIEPLRNELKSLEAEAEVNKRKAEENTQCLDRLKRTIDEYEQEYGSLKYEAKLIEESLKSVEAKVSRSMALLTSLSSEQIRWDRASHEFKAQMENIAGDVLLSAAFLAYAGFFDQQSRTTLFDLWRAHLRQSHIKYRPDLALTEYLSSPDERLRWQANALPSDDLCTENAIMLRRFNRYPLIIDPSGQATKFLLNEFKGRKITRTSFLDDSFRKNLESALRFGNPLLVQDVENYDPILNPVLNREVRRTAGRVLISLGDQDIDLSPSFAIFLSTRDPSVEFSPDICSRVTFVNFTITQSSLQSQCLHRALKAERPDIDEKRSNLLKLQGEFQVRLRQLEKSLLQALNDSKGRILDDDSVISTLEKLKLEADDISAKVAETDRVIEEVETVSAQYQPLALACSSIFFTMDRLNQVHSLYQYSLDFFFTILDDVLTRTPQLEGVHDKTKRLSIIVNSIFERVYQRITRGMMHHDWVVFAMLLAKIYLKTVVSQNDSSYDTKFDYYLRNRRAIAPSDSQPELQQPQVTSTNLTSIEPYTPIEWLTSKQNEALESLSMSDLSDFRKVRHLISQHEQEIRRWLNHLAPETCVPTSLWASPPTPGKDIGKAFNELLLVKALRPDRLPAATSVFVRFVLGERFVRAADTEVKLAEVVEKEIRASTPVLMCSAPGYDASGRVDELAVDTSHPCTSIALGSAEGFNQAEQAINAAAKSGKWVQLKNVHLAPMWLIQLEKKLYSLEAHPSFRLFLTLEIHPKIPVNLLRAGRVFVYEPPPGVRANLLRTFNAIPAAQMMRSPNERCRLHLLLAWFHAIVQERLRYTPLGWSKLYEFSESDLKVAAATLDTWLDACAQARTNIAPERIPWDAIRTLLGECIYGGKVDNIFDHRLLASFLAKFFTPKSFEPDFLLVHSPATHLNQQHEESNKEEIEDIKIPEGMRRDEFLAWIDQSLAAAKESPVWLGLPPNAERVILTNHGHDIIRKLLRLQALEDEDEVLAAISRSAGDSSSDSSLVSQLSGGDVRPAYMKTLHADIGNWLGLLPEQLDLLHRTVDNIKDALFRFFEREICTAARLLVDVRKDLMELRDCCDPDKRTKQTNYHRDLIERLVKEQVPDHWSSRYKVPKDIKVSTWVTDFAERIRQLAAVVERGAQSLRHVPINLGRLLNPEAYITATRQYVAQANSWSLEELQLQFTIHDAASATVSASADSFTVLGLHLEGATSRNNKLYLTSEIVTEVSMASLRWIKRDLPVSLDASSDALPMISTTISLPVYLDNTRHDLLFTVEMDPDEHEDVASFFERGVAIICCSVLS
ncbi:Dynein heavy chain, cytoplasmic, partial [Fragariocoptes setiger]